MATAFRMPTEHGAWGILLVPYVCAAVLAGIWNLGIALVGVASLSLFLLRGSIEAQAIRAAWREPIHLALLGAGAGSGVALVFIFHLRALIWLAIAGAALYSVQRSLARSHEVSRQEKRSLAAELTGVALLTLTAPATWIAARGRLDPAGVKVWLLNLLFFLGGVLYVKYRVRGLLTHQQFASFNERMRFAWPVIVYHILLVGFLVGAVLVRSFPAAVVLAFAPGVLRALALLPLLGRRFPIRRLGWSEVAHAVAFAALLILTFRGL